MSHSPLTSEFAIREALARDDELRFQLALRESELQKDVAARSDADDTEPVPALPEESDLQLPRTPSSFNWRSGTRYMQQLLHFGNPAAQGSVQDPSDEYRPETYLGNDAL